MSIPVVVRNVRELPTDLVDDPEIAMRETFNDDAFRELVESIRLNGIQVALIVEPRAERYRVIAGHRRLKAARVLGAVTVPCDVRSASDVDAEAIKVLENDDREAVNPAEAAVYLHRLWTERCGGDVDAVCALVRRSRQYVEDRLLLFQGDEEVFEALRAREIRFGVAKELNQITDIGYRRLHLDQARKYGMTAAAAKDARRQSNFATREHGTSPPASSASGEAAPAPAAYQPSCYVCGRHDRPERMRYMTVHDDCDTAIGARVLAAFREEPGSGAADGS